MFFIVNKTERIIALNDIGVTLGPRQAINLDKRVPREKSENSKDLKNRIADRLIEVKQKDHNKPLIEYTVKIQQATPPPNVDVEKLKQELLKELLAGMKAVGNDIKETISQQQPVIIQQTGSTTPIAQTSEEIKVDDAVLADIHARAVDKMSKDTKSGNVNYSEQKVEATQIDQNASELEDLLGG